MANLIKTNIPVIILTSSIFAGLLLYTRKSKNVVETAKNSSKSKNLATITESSETKINKCWEQVKNCENFRYWAWDDIFRHLVIQYIHRGVSNKCLLPTRNYGGKYHDCPLYYFQGYTPDDAKYLIIGISTFECKSKNEFKIYIDCPRADEVWSRDAKNEAEFQPESYVGEWITTIDKIVDSNIVFFLKSLDEKKNIQTYKYQDLDPIHYYSRIALYLGFTECITHDQLIEKTNNLYCERRSLIVKLIDDVCPFPAEIRNEILLY